MNPDSKKSDPIETEVVRSGTQTTARISTEIRPKTINSKIITFQDVELISKWIDRLEITADKIKNSN